MALLFCLAEQRSLKAFQRVHADTAVLIIMPIKAETRPTSAISLQSLVEITIIVVLLQLPNQIWTSALASIIYYLRISSAIAKI